MSDKWLEISPKLLEVRDAMYSNSPESILPPQDCCFRALESVDPQEVRVVVLGQDPYHTPGKACGLAFGYHPNYKGPVDSSLANILTEVERDGFTRPEDLSLSGWAEQGVLLLNTRLTVEVGKPMSHANRASGTPDMSSRRLGWEDAVRTILSYLGQLDQPLVWMLWGREAQNAHYRSCPIQHEDHLVLVASHPCRYSVDSGRFPFRSCHHFRDTNLFLREHGLPEIDWSK